VVADRDPAVYTSHGFLEELFDRESSVAFALVVGANVKPRRVAVVQLDVISWGERGHDEAHQLVPAVDAAGPGGIPEVYPEIRRLGPTRQVGFTALVTLYRRHRQSTHHSRRHRLAKQRPRCLLRKIREARQP
jgi:hypothetical protein